MTHSSFLQEVAIALAGCQEVELILKLYIEQARLRQGDRSAYDISERPLGPLIKDFQKFSGNNDLASLLNQFREKRNHLVHNAISACLNEDDDEGALDDQKVAASFLSLKKLQLDAYDLRNQIAVEHSKLFTIYDNIPIPPDAV